MSGLWNFSVRVQSWSAKFLKLIRPIQSWSANVKSCILFCLMKQNKFCFAFYFASWGKFCLMRQNRHLTRQCLFCHQEQKLLLELFCHHASPFAWFGHVTRMIHLHWSHHILQTFRPLRMFKIVFRDSSLYPKPLSLYCLPRAYARGVGVNPYFSLICYKNVITCEKEINGFRMLFA